MAPPIADQSAIAFVRFGPDQSAVIRREGRRVRHAGGKPAHDPGDEQDLDRRGETGEQGGRDRQRHPEHDHPLAPVAVAEGAEVEDRGGKPERIADGDEVELGLARVERLADVGQGDVGDREVEVGDRRDEDQDAEHGRRTSRAWSPLPLFADLRHGSTSARQPYPRRPGVSRTSIPSPASIGRSCRSSGSRSRAG